MSRLTCAAIVVGTGLTLAGPVILQAVLGNVMGIITGDTDDVVRRRAVSSLGVIAADSGVPALIQLARTGQTPAIRKEAVSTLARTTDARARAFLEELVAR